MSLIAKRIGTRHLIWEYGLIERICTYTCMYMYNMCMECNIYNTRAYVYLINALMPRQTACVWWYTNETIAYDSLQCQVMTFKLPRVTWKDSEHKNLLSSCHVSRLMVALQDKTLSDDSPSLNFRKGAIPATALIDGLSWTTAKLSLWFKSWRRKCGLCLHLEMVDVRSR